MDEWVLHIDGDGFFAYCEIARFPHLRGAPVVVGEDRGIVCACTYEAKALGISRAMPIFEVREKFPQVTILGSHFELYKQYASMLETLVEPEVDVLERYSIDECFALKKFPNTHTKEDLMVWLRNLKSFIQAATGLTYSFGLARTKLLAKIASKREKPDGCTIIMANEETEVLKTTSIGSLWGIGWRLGRRFERMRVTTAYEFACWEPARVQDTFAEPTQELWKELHGTKQFAVSDSTSLHKSIQATRSFTGTSSDQTFILAELLHNADIAFTRMRTYGLTTNAITLYLKTKDRRYHSTNIQLPHYTDNPMDVLHKIHTEAAQLFVPTTRYRSTGITVWNLRLKTCLPDDLFGLQSALHEKNTVMKTIDQIRHKYGQGSISILGSLPSVHSRSERRESRRKTESYVYGLPLAYLGEVM